MKQNASTARPSGALISNTLAVSCTSLYEHAKKSQKRTNDSRTAALQSITKQAEKLRRPAAVDCVRAVRMAYCENGHMFAKPVFCGYESCEYCGQNNSPAHHRRINSILSGVLSWSAVSYLVVTIPYEIRGLYYSKKDLNEFRTFVRRKLKKDGFTTATLRWHWSGDCKSCKGKRGKVESCSDCHSTGCGKEYHPHINILLPAGNIGKVTAYAGDSCKLRPAYLESWRKSLAAWFKKRHKNYLPDHKYRTNIYHNFIPAVGSWYYSRKARQAVKMDRDTFEKMARHRVRYITRATLRHPDLVNSFELILKKYKNTSHIGHWSQTDAEPMACPCCDKPLRWYAEPAVKFHDIKDKLVEFKQGLFFLNFLAYDTAPPS